jgi:hypothetical protein
MQQIEMNVEVDTSNRDSCVSLIPDWTPLAVATPDIGSSFPCQSPFSFPLESPIKNEEVASLHKSNVPESSGLLNEVNLFISAPPSQNLNIHLT